MLAAAMKGLAGDGPVATTTLHHCRDQNHVGEKRSPLLCSTGNRGCTIPSRSRQHRHLLWTKKRRGRVTACVAVGARDFDRCCRSRSRRTSSEQGRSPSGAPSPGRSPYVLRHRVDNAIDELGRRHRHNHVEKMRRPHADTRAHTSTQSTRRRRERCREEKAPLLPPTTITHHRHHPLLSPSSSGTAEENHRAARCSRRKEGRTHRHLHRRCYAGRQVATVECCFADEGERQRRKKGAIGRNRGRKLPSAHQDPSLAVVVTSERECNAGERSAGHTTPLMSSAVATAITTSRRWGDRMLTSEPTLRRSPHAVEERDAGRKNRHCCHQPRSRIIVTIRYYRHRVRERPRRTTELLAAHGGKRGEHTATFTVAATPGDKLPPSNVALPMKEKGSVGKREPLAGVGEGSCPLLTRILRWPLL
nr:hypothetical protein Iba_chr10aCG13170 [Ipomoea batatas]